MTTPADDNGHDSARHSEASGPPCAKAHQSGPPAPRPGPHRAAGGAPDVPKRILTAALADAGDDERATVIDALARLHQLLVADQAPPRPLVLTIQEDGAIRR
ncbi:hypothetical protein NGB36_25070 [Streptomyces sp. RB6PN25]|uniref:Uncharacterized protein n=1 Tax=Streptomyces humicola TaxID=2953240 RepID=A0ABT1Q1G4_9ACTN|nr:hypothetical protein [Streptomyces humicola]MCQ4083775.1 hypothetical protein [Streptomyces humicola]